MKMPYLIQRGTFKENINISKIEGIDSILSFNYMGSSEFEFNALPASLKRFMKEYYKPNIDVHSIKINNKDFWIYCTSDFDENDITAITNLFQLKVTNPYGGLKEVIDIDHYFEGKYTKQLKRGCIKKTEIVVNWGYCDFWWDIENDYFVFPDENSNQKLFDLALKALSKRGFGKE